MEKIKYVAYYRVSTDKQGASGLGLEAQKDAVKKYLKDKYPPEFQFTEIESGKNSDRPELKKALELCKKEKAVLIVAKLDRLSRDLHFITSLSKAKIKFICCDMPEATPLTINIMGTLAQWEREQISNRTKQALAQLKKQGMKFGYNHPKTRAGLERRWKLLKKNKAKAPKKIKQKKELIIRTKKADAFAESLRTTFQLLKEQGLSLSQMSQKLASLGVKTRQGKQAWNKTQVVRIRKRLNI